MAGVKLNNGEMNLLQNVRHDIHSSAWSEAGQARALARMTAPWQRCLGRCHGLQAVVVGSTLTLPDRGGCRIPHQTLLTADLAVTSPRPLIHAHWRHWPLRPGSIDMVILALDAQHLPHLPALINEITVALGPDAWLLVMTQAGPLAPWCRIGMPLAARRGLILRESHWGDARKLSWLPPAWAHYWSEQWQNWFPGTAQWTVQLWQKQTLCLIAPERKTSRNTPTSWSGSWAPQSRAGTSQLKDCA